MSGATVHDSNTRAAALALIAQGLSPEEAAQRLSRGKVTLTGRTVRRWVAAGHKAPAGPPPKPPAASKPDAPPPPVHEDTSELEAEAAEVLDAIGAADRAYTRLDQLHARMVERLDKELREPEPSAKVIRDLGGFMLEINTTLAKSRPPQVLTPEQDPTNLAAAEALIERVTKLVAASRRARGLEATG